MILKEIKKIKSTKKELKEFGIVIGIILTLLGGLLWWRGREYYVYFLIFSPIFLILGLLLPQVLKPIQIVWMILAAILGWVMTRVILTILFYFIITPTGLLMKLIGKDVLSLKFNRNADSYWVSKEKPSFDKKNYEKQF